MKRLWDYSTSIRLEIDVDLDEEMRRDRVTKVEEERNVSGVWRRRKGEEIGMECCEIFSSSHCLYHTPSPEKLDEIDLPADKMTSVSRWFHRGSCDTQYLRYIHRHWEKWERNHWRSWRMKSISFPIETKLPLPFSFLPLSIHSFPSEMYQETFVFLTPLSLFLSLSSLKQGRKEHTHINSWFNILIVERETVV